jgi:hypothetical protein
VSTTPTTMASSYEIEACNSTSSTSLLLGGASTPGPAAGQRGSHQRHAHEHEHDDTIESRRSSSTTYACHRSNLSHALRKTSTRVLLCALAGIAIVAGLFATDGLSNVSSTSAPFLSYVASKAKDGSGYLLGSLSSSSSSPFYPLSSPSALPPALSSLPPSLKRITLISIWAGNNDQQPDYLNNFFRSAALNKEVADLLVIHIINDASKCLSEVRDDGIVREAADWNWETAGGNIRIVCRSRETHLAEEAEFLCSQDGWNCDEAAYKDVVCLIFSPVLGTKQRASDHVMSCLVLSCFLLRCTATPLARARR